MYASEEIQITDENIVISDEDTPAQELIIKIVTKPTYGNLINTEQSEGKLYMSDEDASTCSRSRFFMNLFCIPYEC